MRKAGARPKRSPRRFGSYAAMEAANILLLPGLALYLGRPGSAAEWVAFALSAAATALFLLVGTLYWRALHRRLAKREASAMNGALRFADRAEMPGFVLIGLAVVALNVALWLEGWSPAVIAAAVLTLLAILEYVNYYQRQLQHFDNFADFKRLLTGGGLKRSHMARDLATFRAAAKGAA